MSKFPPLRASLSVADTESFPVTSDHPRYTNTTESGQSSNEEAPHFQTAEEAVDQQPALYSPSHANYVNSQPREIAAASREGYDQQNMVTTENQYNYENQPPNTYEDQQQLQQAAQTQATLTPQDQQAETLAATSPHHTEEKHEEDTMAKHQFNRNRSFDPNEIHPNSTNADENGLIKGPPEGLHCSALLSAIMQLVLHLFCLLFDLFLIANYDARGHRNAAGSILAIRVVTSLVRIGWSHLHRGLSVWDILHLFHLHIVYDFVKFSQEWNRHRRKYWSSSIFRQHLAYESFIATVPSLITQTYALLVKDPSDTYHASAQSYSVTTIIAIAFVSTSLLACIDLWSYFNYIRIAREIYVSQLCKAVITTAARVLLVAYLLYIIGPFFWLWIFGSFVLGVVLYWWRYIWSRKLGRIFLHQPSHTHKENDDPLLHTFPHFILSLHMSLTWLFVSVPFSTTHSVYDWWYGYLFSELKIQIDNLIMIFLVIFNVLNRTDEQKRNQDSNNNTPTFSRDVFYSLTAFCFILYLGNLIITYFIHLHVRKHLTLRKLYSTRSIVKFYTFAFRSWRVKHYPDELRSLELRVQHEEEKYFNNKAEKRRKKLLKQQQQQQQWNDENTFPTHVVPMETANDGQMYG